MSVKTKKIILYILLVLILAFIWGNSLLDREQSSKQSGIVAEIVEPILDAIYGEGNWDDTPVRKAAHFFEFSCLGVVLSLLCLIYENDIYRPLLFGLMTALTDETIQYFTKRGSMCKDVWLDYSAVVLVSFIIYKINKRKKLSTYQHSFPPN